MTVSEIMITYHTNIFTVTQIANSHDYETVKDLIEESLINLPDSSLLQIAGNKDYKVPINKLVIGKPIIRHTPDIGGYMSPEELAASVKSAMSLTASRPEQWKAGIMVWDVCFFDERVIKKILICPISISAINFFMTSLNLLPRFLLGSSWIDDGQKGMNIR
jgi:hypothetical protein